MNKNTVISIVIVAALFLGGCQPGPSALDQAGTLVAATVAAAPTDKPVSTTTPVPNETYTPFPTVTANPALTTTVEAMSVLSELDVHIGSNSDVPYDAGQLAWKQSEPLVIDMTGPQKDLGILEPVGESIDAANFIFKSKVTWNSSGALICGLTFRAEEDLARGKQYQFYFYRISGLPAYKIDVYDLARFKNTISDVKYSDHLDYENGKSNDFALVARGERFTVYINGHRQGDYHDTSKQRMDGRLAFLAWQDSGKGNCTFEESWLWILP